MAVLPPDPVFCLRDSTMGHLHSLCFQENESNFTTKLAAASESGFVFFWDLQTNRLEHKQSMGESIQSVHFYRDYFITQEKRGVVKFWTQVTSGQYELCQDKVFECGGGFCRLIIIDDCLVTPALDNDSSIDIINLETTTRRTLEPPVHKITGDHVMCLEPIARDSRRLVLSGYDSGFVRLWDPVTSSLLAQIRLRECVTSLTFDAVTSRGVAANASSDLQLFTVSDDVDMTLKYEIGLTSAGCGVVRLRPDRKILAAGCWDGSLRLFSWKSLRALAVLREHRKGALGDVRFSPAPVERWGGGSVMAACGSDGVISLWNLYNN